MKKPLTERQCSLLDYHRDIAQLVTKTGEVFWILDLTDRTAFDIMAHHYGLEKVTNQRDATLRTDSIPAHTMTGSVLRANAILQSFQAVPVLSADNRYVALMSEGLVVVTEIRLLQPKQKKGIPHGNRQTQINGLN